MLRNWLIASLALPLVEKHSQTRAWSLANATLQQHGDGYDDQANRKEKLVELFSVAAKVPYWQSLTSARKIDWQKVNAETVFDVLAKFPLSTKQTYARGFPEKLIYRRHFDEHQWLSSAGTSERMTVITDFAKRDSLRALEQVNTVLSHQQQTARRTLDIPPSVCNITCGLENQGPEPLVDYLPWFVKGRCWRTPERLSDLRGRLERQVLFRRTTGKPVAPAPWLAMVFALDEHLEHLIVERIEVLRGYPLFLYWLALRAKERNIALPDLQVILPYGGLAGDTLVKRSCDALDVDFVNLYGTGEFGSVGASQHGQQGIAVYQDDVIVELLDEQEEKIETLDVVGRVVITDLNNHAMPIIRYVVGDLAKWQQETGGERTLLLVGRVAEQCTLPEQSPLQARALQNLVLADDNIVNFCLHQCTDTVFRLSVSQRQHADTNALRDRLQTRLGKGTIVEVRVEPFIPDESSGKYLSFKQVVKPASDKASTSAVTITEGDPCVSVDLRAHFPLLSHYQQNERPLIYLDSAATALKPQPVITAVNEILGTCTANIHRGVHFLGDEATDRFEEARAHIARFIGGAPEHVVLLRNTTECINLVARQFPRQGGVLISLAEHHSNDLPWVGAFRLPLMPDLSLDMMALEDKLQKTPSALIALSHISNVTGAEIDVKGVVRLARQYGAKVLLDAAQSAPHQPLDVIRLDVDFLVFSSHKIGGPSGVGVLYGKPEHLNAMPPLFFGGAMVDQITEGEVSFKPVPWRFEAGTPAIESVVGLGVAAKWLMTIGMETVHQQTIQLTQYTRALAIDIFGDKAVLGPRNAPGPISIHLKGNDPHVIARLLSEHHGICVRAGYHCAQPLHQSLGLSGTLRISPWLYNTTGEVDKTLLAISTLLR